MRGALCSPERENRAKRVFSSVDKVKRGRKAERSEAKGLKSEAFAKEKLAEGIKSEAFGRSRPRLSIKSEAFGEGLGEGEAKRSLRPKASARRPQKRSFC